MSAAVLHPLAPGLAQLRAAIFGGPARTAAEQLPAPGDELARLRRRDPDAWHVLFDREMPAIYRYALGSVGAAAEAEDIASAVFAEAWESAGRLEDHGLPARAWLFGIARNIIASHRRKLFRRPPVLSIEPYDAPDERAVLDPEHLDLARAVQRLDRVQGEVVVLRFVHGLSLQETAAVLNVSVDSVKGRQARALTALRKLLEG
ncbi:MAG: sigma-70 family RNA polymerase sigma factor [Dehalococcoidia bacterium]|nr:sigma-70 family RNA polymerase sigma factor [Dehalococcoidia bacterium]